MGEEEPEPAQEEPKPKKLSRADLKSTVELKLDISDAKVKRKKRQEPEEDDSPPPPAKKKLSVKDLKKSVEIKVLTSSDEKTPRRRKKKEPEPDEAPQGLFDDIPPVAKEVKTESSPSIDESIVPAPVELPTTELASTVAPIAPISDDVVAAPAIAEEAPPAYDPSKDIPEVEEEIEEPKKKKLSRDDLKPAVALKL